MRRAGCASRGPLNADVRTQLRQWALSLAFVGHWGCGSDDLGSDIYSGYFISSFEVQAFAADGADEKWWLEGGPFPCLKSEPTHEFRTTGPVAYVVVQGDLKWNGRGGRDGYARTLHVTNVLGCRRIKNEEHVSIEF